MSAGTRRNLTLAWTVLFVLSLLMQAGVLSNPPSALAVHDDGLFELDGNAAAGAAAGDDWSLLDDGAGDPNNDDSADASIFLVDAVPERSFTTGGSKDDLDTAAGGATTDFWMHTQQNVPDKDDIQHAFAALYGDKIYFGADRYDNDGDAQVGFWFFKNGINVNGNGTFSPKHTVGDLLVLSHFTNGGAASTIELYEWVGSGGDTNTTLDLVATGQLCTSAPADDKACAIANATDQPAPWPYDAKQPDPDNIFGANAFFEGGLDLSEVFEGEIPCFTGFLVETRASQSVDATLQDFTTGAFDTCASITIVKNAVPDDAQDFAFTTNGTGLSNFSLDDDANATLPNTISFDGLNPGAYSVTEGAVANWQLTGLDCDDADSVENVGTRTASINLSASENVTCTFTNTRYGRILVDKVTNPGGSSQSFEFDPSYGSNFFLTDAATPNDSGFLAPGSYSVAEVNIPADWDLTSATCSDGSPVNSISLALNETVTCTFTNRQDGHIVVDKVTDPSGSSQSFEFDPSYGSNFNLTDTATPNDSGHLDPGTYSVVELTPPGWDLTNVSCSDGSANTAINLGPGETVTCTFSNRQDGKIIVVKQTTPDGSSQVFEFDPSWGSNFNLSDGQSNDSGFLDPGTYSVAEVNIPAGWDLTSATCSDGSAVGSISLQAGETVTCTFNDRQDGKIIVVKQTTPDGSSQSFEFDPSYGSNFNLTDGQSNDSGFLDPGTYSVAEVNLPAGWDLTGSSCNDGSAVDSISLQAGETVTCTFNNRQDGKIVVIKQTLPDGASQSFEFDPSYASNFFLTDGQQNTSAFLDPGEYSVAEVNIPTGWDLTGASCDQGETVDDIDLGAGETVTCTFTNTQRGHIVVDKVTNPSGDPQSFSFDAGGSGYGDFSLTDAAAPNNQEVVPGAYSVSESVPSGWDLTSATCDQGETPASIDVGPGETVTCTFTNTKRGTIIVEKQTSPDGASGSFTFSGSAAGSIGDGGTITVPNLVPGPYSSTEADPAPDFDLTSILCNDTNSTGNLGTRTANFVLDPGETVKCTFTNVQRGTITIIKDAQPNDAQDFAYTSSFGPFDLDDDANATLSNSKAFGNVAPGDYSVTEALVAGWDLTNLSCVTVGAGTTATPNGASVALHLAAGGSITCTYVNSKPSISIVKTAGNAADGAVLVQGAGNVTYHYVVTNTGPIALQNIVVRDDNGTAGTGDDFTVTCPKATLAAGESMECTATVAVNANRTNVATVTGESSQGTDVSDQDDAVVRVPSISIDKSHNDADGTVAQGQTVGFTILVSVTNGPVTNAVVTDVLPDGQTYVGGSQSSSPAATFQQNGQTLTWTFASLPTGNPAATITYNVTIDGDAAGALTNEAEVCVAEPGVACDDDDSTVTVPGLSILKDVSGFSGGTAIDGTPIAKIGDILTYTLTYAISDPPAHLGVITDPIPGGLEYVLGSATTNAEFDTVEWDPASKTLTWTADLVTVGGSVTFQVTVLEEAPDLAQPINNIATIDSADTPPDDDDAPVLVQEVQDITNPPTSTIDNPKQTPSNPGFSLMLILLALAAFALSLGYVTPVPERARRRTEGRRR